MRLRDWLDQQNMTTAEFARRSGIGLRQVVHRYVHGTQFPSPANLRRIREATGGAVTADDFVDHHVGRTTKPRARA